ncbi:GGDEF domain-containing protein, partial [Shewanella sp. MBTL60-007]|uniref:GGDEF domain-containing protein n=1 Tax=Shewanella sp. MBTL60-007 TaxID=2815911 RepID=UPI001C8261D0
KNSKLTILVEKPISYLLYDMFLFFFFSLFFFIVFHYIEKIKRYHELVEKERFQDSLTGLYNSRKLSIYLDKIISKQEPFLMLYMDLNGFKIVNDTYGHDVGDKLLKAFSGRISHSFSDDTFVSRIGGDEFVMVFNGEHTDEHRANFIAKIKQIAKQVFRIGNLFINISTSVGYAKFPIEKNKKEEIVKLADMRMFQDKQ